MYLLDTNHCSLAIQHQPDIIAQLSALGQAQVSTCVIVQAELIYMAENSQNQQNNLQLVEKFLQNVFIYAIDSSTAKIYGAVQAELMRRFGPKEKSKRRRTRLIDLGVSQNDLWIAAIALQHNLILVSADSDFQRIQTVRDLPIESWYNPTTST
ncbi:twitching motility protein PilT [Planktothricoides sp. SR001]|uniref:type II toxin-antitoxin system VapC family toxin n=1 Tax=Planktothricoides sp. SR001 TaxID=1705388 RepID=UPI0006C3A374|nr:type II toxin-antitoxin system VapC family toxin [Planktothricoides sp. SR001]KOR38344.1 twitching motility protein PilT [Planktothricoides sp. SR001]